MEIVVTSTPAAKLSGLLLKLDMNVTLTELCTVACHMSFKVNLTNLSLVYFKFKVDHLQNPKPNDKTLL